MASDLCPTCGANRASDNPNQWCACPKTTASNAGEEWRELEPFMGSDVPDKEVVLLDDVKRLMAVERVVTESGSAVSVSYRHPALASNAGEREAFEPDRLESIIDDYLEDYEMRGEDEDGRDACHTPSDGERFLIKDAIMGLLADSAWDAEWGKHIDSMANRRASLATKPPAGEQKPTAQQIADYLRGLDGMVSVKAEDANNYCRVLTALGMEEEGDPVAAIEDLKAAVHDAEEAALQPEQLAQDKEHAENYRLIRRGQHWSVVDGIGNTLRGEGLDAAVDAIRAARARGEGKP